MEGVLKSWEDSRSSLHHQLADQKQLTDSTRKKAERLEKSGAKIIIEACKKGFFASLERCKSMIHSYLFNLDAKLS